MSTRQGSTSAGRQPPPPEVDENTPLLQPPVVDETQLSQPPLPPSQGGSNKPTSPAPRQIAADVQRGLLVALMALDHASVSLRAYEHGTAIGGENTEMEVHDYNNTLAYVLRTFTHLCAPGFAMLMGMGLAYALVSKKTRQHSTPLDQLKHLAVRAIAILLVNVLSLQLILTKGAIWKMPIFNIVLPALAIDYFFVGAGYLVILYAIEPALQRLLEPDERKRFPAILSASSIVNMFLLVVSALLLWTNIWSSPHQGACPFAEKTHPNLHGSAAESFVLSALTPAALPKPSGYDYCRSTKSLLFGLAFQSVNCPQFGIISGFPPIGWLGFVTFGLLYGRLLLSTHSSSASSSSPSPSSRLRPSIRSTSLNLLLSVTFALLFLSTRLFSYGNLSTHCLHASDQSAGSRSNQYFASLKSFFYIVKYPPSPSFGFFSLSANFLLLYLFSLFFNHVSTSRPSSSVETTPSPSPRPSASPRSTSWILSPTRNPLLTFGLTPLFFYGAHFYVLYTLRYLLSLLFPSLIDHSDGTEAIRVGLSPTFALSYAVVLLAMWVLCAAFGKWKRRKGPESIWRFL